MTNRLAGPRGRDRSSVFSAPTPLLLVLAIVAQFGLASAPFAADEARILRARAAELASRDDCAGALRLLDEADDFDSRAVPDATESRAPIPMQAEVDLLRGRCLVSLQRFEAARPALERAVASDPRSGEAALALGIVRYELGDAEGAYEILERAEVLLPNRPEPPLYLGLILIDREESAAAAGRFEQSGRLAPDGFDPIPDYYAAIAHAGAGDVERSEDALRRVQERGAGTVWGDRADELLAGSEARGRRGPLNRWLRLQAGLDYDTNVSLRSDRVAQPGNISDDEDGRGWWGIDAGAELFRKGGWAGGVGAQYTGYEYFESQSYRQHFATGRVWLDRDLGEDTLFRISPEAGIGFFDTGEYLRFYGVRPELRHDFGRGGLGRLYFRYAYDDFREDFDANNLAGLRNALDRDGHDLRGGYDHEIGVAERTTLRGGVFGRHYLAEGSEYDHSGVGGWLGFTQGLPWRFTLDATGSVAYDEYDGKSNFLLAGEPRRAREDIIGTASAVLSRPITDWLTLAARYHYLNNDSNTAVFDYDRHLVGAFFTLDLLELFR